MPKRKVKLIEVETTDYEMKDGKYNSSYRGNIVQEGSIINYYEVDGKTSWSITKEIADLLLGKEVRVIEVVEKGDAPIAPVAPNSVSLIDAIGAKPKSLNIEF